MRKFKSIIFDCDGVLVDSEFIAGQVEARVKTETGFPISLENQLKQFSGLGKFHPDQQAELKKLPAHYLKTVDDEIWKTYKTDLKPIGQIRDVLKKINIPICVASSSETEWIKYKLKITGLLPYFENRIFSGQMVKRTKPEPDLFLLALEKLEWLREHTLVIEDSIVGVMAARAAGLSVWGFLGGGHVRPGHENDLLSAGAERCFSDFSILLEPHLYNSTL